MELHSCTYQPLDRIDLHDLPYLKSDDHFTCVTATLRIFLVFVPESIGIEQFKGTGSRFRAYNVARLLEAIFKESLRVNRVNVRCSISFGY